MAGRWHPAFGAITRRGLEVSFQVNRMDGFPDVKHLTLVAWDGDRLAASADFLDDGQPLAVSQNVRVAPEHRRCGMTSALYVLAEAIFQKPLQSMWDGENSAAVRALWDNPRRPFGHPAGPHIDRHPKPGPADAGNPGR